MTTRRDDGADELRDDVAAFLDAVDVKRLRRVPGEAPLDKRERDVVFDAADSLDVLVAGWRKVLALCDEPFLVVGEDGEGTILVVEADALRAALVEAASPTPTPTAEETKT